ITGAAQPKLSQSNLKRLQVAAPPYPAQARIGSVIRALDDLIENNRRRVEILEEMARLLYWEWFVHFRFPRHEDVELVDSELGRIPEGWEVGRVGDCLTLQRGFDLPVRDRNEAGAVPVLAASGFHGRHDEIRVDGPGVVTGRSGTIGRSFLVHEDFWPLNTVLWAKEFKLGGPAFAHGLLESIDLTRVAGGAAVPTLNRNHLHAMSHVVPPAALASTYCDAVDPLHDLRANLEDQNELLRETRDLLLPRLVSGELDVSEPDLDSVLA
ncbi:MAG: restriction endonuclease subunit S, partial [bacterium]|nr:restriction endonuclease subunit S [bacterium]